MKTVRLLKKSQYHEEIDSEGSWAISYGDMITLLLSFFVIFFTTDFKQQKVEKLNQHLSFKLEDAEPTKFEAQDTIHPVAASFPELKDHAIKTHNVGDNIIVTFQATSFYSSGKVSVNDIGTELLKKFSQNYLPYAGNYRLAIKGFTDKRPVIYREVRTKKYDDNLELSVLRSIAAMRILQANGIPLNRMEIAGAGELEDIDKVIPRKEGLTEEEIDSYSRTLVLVVKPIKESWL